MINTNGRAPSLARVLCVLCIFFVARVEGRNQSVVESQQEGQQEAQLSKNTTAILNGLLDGYDKNLRPGFGGPPLEIESNIHVRSMGPITEKDMVFSFDCYFRQYWRDQRLAYIDSPLPTLALSNRMLSKIWKPDTYFFNGKHSHLHVITVPNKLFRISEDGNITYSMRLTIKASCPMNLQHFPMDTQLCPLSLGSYGYSSRDVTYKWSYGDSDSVRRDPGVKLSQFSWVSTIGSSGSVLLDRGNFSVLSAQFKLKRHMGFFLIQVYIPCILLVILSWVGFFINREATADRIGLGITTFLTMAFVNLDTRNDLPKVSYSTALDWFMALCFSFIMASIIQFAVVHFFTKLGSGEATTMDQSDSENDDDVFYDVTFNGQSSKTPADSSSSSKSSGQSLRLSPSGLCTQLALCLRGTSGRTYMAVSAETPGQGVNSSSRADMLSRILFPSAFAVINIFYWASYLNTE